MRGRLVLPGIVIGVVAVMTLILFWVLHASLVNHWLAVHTGTVDEPGPYYAFWSGFGSDLAEFGIIGAIATGVYQLVKEYNCHEPGRWRVGTLPAAGGQFLLCWRHHPDFQGRRPTHELIERLHQEHLANQEAIHQRSASIHRRIGSGDTREPDTSQH